MIPVEHYINVYFIVLTYILLFIFLPVYFSNPLDRTNSTLQKLILFGLIGFTVAFIGFRDTKSSPKYLGDTIAYTKTYERMQDFPNTEFTKDDGFYYFMNTSSKFISVQWFYVLCSFLYVYLPFLTFKKWFKGRGIYVLIVYIVSFSFIPFGVNGLRNGLAAAIFIYALSFFNRKTILMYVLLIASISFHKGMLLPAFAFILSKYFSNPKKLLFLWLASIPLSLLFNNAFQDLTFDLFNTQGIIHDERAGTYFSDETVAYKVKGMFRLDFILYSSIAVILGYWAIIKQGYDNILYNRVYGAYVISNALWILLIYAPYTNRIAYLSWFIMPVVLAAPFVGASRFRIRNNKEKLFYVMYGSLLFTLVMEIV